MTRLRVGTWNVRTERDFGRARRALSRIFREHEPHVFLGQEMYAAPELDGMFDGYGRVYQVRDPRRVVNGVTQEHGAQVIFVRDDVRLNIAAALAMSKTWRGPYGQKHAPRIHRRVTVTLGGKTARVLGWHGNPGVSGRWESNRAAERNLATLGLIGPVILGGDLNQKPEAVRRRIRGDYRITAPTSGKRLDMFLSRGCGVRNFEVLPAYGSDHNPLMADFII